MRVQAVEPPASGGEVVGQFGVEEIVGVTVHRQDRARRRCRVGGANQGGEQAAFAVGVGAQRACGLDETGEDVVSPLGLHCRHGSTLTAGVALTTPPVGDAPVGIACLRD